MKERKKFAGRRERLPYSDEKRKEIKYTGREPGPEENRPRFSRENDEERPFRRSSERGERKFSGERKERPYGRTGDRKEKPFGRTSDRADKPFGRTGDRAERPFGRTGERKEKPFGRTGERTEKPFGRTGERKEKPFGRDNDRPKRSFGNDESSERRFERKKSFGSRERSGDGERRERSSGRTGERNERSFGKPDIRRKRSFDNDESGEKPFERKKSFGGRERSSSGRDGERKERSFGRSGGVRKERSFEKPEIRRKSSFEKEERGERRSNVKRDSRKGEDLIRLNKYIANAGICSRREADVLIQSGVITVNGEIITELGYKVSREDKVKYADQPLNSEKLRYLLLNKPKGFITTVDDPEDRKTVMTLVCNACRERIYPVGRLDRNTTGLLLFTNDGEMAKKLTHPKYGIRKIYHVVLDKNLTKTDMIRISEGPELDDEKIQVDAIEYIKDANDKKEIGLELHSGQNRVVRRIFEALGYKVEKLDRVAFAGLTKKNLPRGEWRFLTQMEINMLKMIH